MTSRIAITKNRPHNCTTDRKGGMLDYGHRGTKSNVDVVRCRQKYGTSKPVSDIYDDYFFYAIKTPLHFGFRFRDYHVCLNITSCWFYQVLSSLFLKQFTESAETTKLDKQFHAWHIWVWSWHHCFWLSLMMVIIRDLPLTWFLPWNH